MGISTISVRMGALLAAAAMAAPALAEERAVEVFVAQDQAVEAGNYAFWDANCAASPFTIEVIEDPSDGAVAIEPSHKPIPAAAAVGTSGNCAGVEVASKAVLYTPKPGYAGTDSFAVTLAGGAGTVTFRYTVFVTPE